ncbi:MAG: DUF5696 domain-containing protein [Oscillospiraceae bacterium]|nr:DUF5696 domain-containing protein [Oscillospiraceae bacterium]
MRRFLCAALALITILSSLAFTACAPSGNTTEVIAVRSFPSGYDGTEEYVFENDFLSMSFNPLTTRFTVIDKKTGEEWASNPADAAESATGLTRNIMQSLLVVNYSTIEGQTTLIDSFEFSVGKENYEYEVFDDGFAVHFTIGNIEDTYYVPKAVPEWRMDQIIENLTTSEKNRMRMTYFRVYDINTLTERDNRSELLSMYPDLEENRVYVINPTLGTHLWVQAQDFFAELGYTPEDYYEDLKFYNIEREQDVPLFNISMYVKLDGRGFTVDIPYDEIQFKNNFPPVEIRVLPFFGAGSLEDEGYMLVPDGSGALINFNNGKSNQIPYSNRIYGWDEALYRDEIVFDPTAHMPVFGIEKNGSALLCVIEEGASYASVKAGVSGWWENGTYNNVFAEYSLIHKENMEISGKSAKNVVVFQRSLPAGEQIVQRYMFCDRDGYMGMAEKYREYLIKRYPHLEKQAVSAVPVAVEILGAVNKNQHILGLPVDQPFKLTSYNEATDIVNDMRARGFGEINYRLTGWFNRSVLHEVPSRVNLISRLGSQRDFENLINTVNQNDSSIYLEADFMYMRNTSIFDSFNVNRDGARFLNRKRIETHPYSFVWYGEFDRDWVKGKAYIARTNFMLGMIDDFMNKISTYGAENIAFRTIGNNLAGDYNERRPISREAAMNMQVDKLKALHGEGHGIMIQSGYAYAAPYADFITDFPLSWQGFEILDEEIPFYQIVLHGLVPYAGRPINLSEDYYLNLLRILESGAGLYFTFMQESPAVLQTSRYFIYYANQYSVWADTAEALHKEFTEQVGDIYNQFIIDYTILSRGVSITEYENGVKVLVNKSDVPYHHAETGHTIGARDYFVIRGDNLNVG